MRFTDIRVSLTDTEDLLVPVDFDGKFLIVHIRPDVVDHFADQLDLTALGDCIAEALIEARRLHHEIVETDPTDRNPS